MDCMIDDIYICDYSAVVPNGPKSGSRRMPMTLEKPVPAGTPRLLGHTPLLNAVEYHPKDWLLYSRVTLSAAPGDKDAVAASVSFSVDRELIKMLRAADVVHVSYRSAGSIGVSVLRDGELVCAIGAVNSVPLGLGITAGIPGPLIDEAEAVFHKVDPDYWMAEWPIEITIGEDSYIRHGGRQSVAGYELYFVHGKIQGGNDVCASIAQIGVCPDVAGPASALLIDREGALLTDWHGRVQ